MLLASIIALTVAPQVARVDAVLHLEIGSLDARSGQVMGNVADLAVDDAGNVYALDDRSDRVFVLAPSGEHLRTFGRRGREPGELNRPMRIDVRDGIATVLNPSGQTNSYSLEGELLASQELPFGAQVAARIGEATYAAFLSGGMSRNTPAPVESLIQVSRGAQDTVLTVPSSDILFRSRTATSGVRTSLCRQAYFVVGDGGELWVASGVEGTLTEWRFGAGVATARRSATVAPAGAALPDTTRARLLGELPRQLDPAEGDLYLPAVLSSVCGLERSNDGTLWVRLRDVAGQETWRAVEVDALRPTLELAAPEGVRLSAFSSDMAYGIRVDEVGNPSVLVYRLE